MCLIWMVWGGGCVGDGGEGEEEEGKAKKKKSVLVK